MKEQCKKDVPTPGMNFYRPKKCARAAVKDGYCTQHHPDSVAARDEKSRKMQEARLKRSPYYMVSELKAALEAAEAERQRLQTGRVESERQIAKLFDTIAVMMDEKAELQQLREATVRNGTALAKSLEATIAELRARVSRLEREAAELEGIVPAIQLGSAGSAFDPPNACRAYTYAEQPGNVLASKLGEVCARAVADKNFGDRIDRGLIFLRELQAAGFGVFQLPAAPKEEV